MVFKRLFKSKPKMDAVFTNKRYPHGSQQIMTDFEHYVHNNRIIQGRFFYFENHLDRRIMSEQMPFYNKYINKVAEKLTEEPIKIVEPGSEEDEEPKVKRNIQLWWNKNRMNEMLQDAIKRIRLDGYCVYYPVNKEKYPDYYGKPPWFILSDKELECVEWDEFGHPIKWVMTLGAQNVEAEEISIEDCFYFDPVRSNDFKPKPLGNDMWDDMIDYIYIKESNKSFLQRIGNGFSVISGPPLTATQLTDVENKMKNVRTEKGLYIPTSKEEPVTVDWMTADGGADFIGALEKIEDSLSVSMEYPKSWLKGDEQGALSAAAMNKMKANAQLKTDFKRYIPFVKGVLKFEKQISDDGNISIIPDVRLDLTDEEKANIDAMKAQTIASKTWLSVNEMRKEDGYGPTDEEGADEVMVEQANEQENTERELDIKEKQANTPQNKIDSIHEQLISMSPSQLANVLGGSITTAQRYLKKWTEPQEKPYDIALKCDAMQIDNDIYEVEGPLITPGELQYQDSPIPDYRSADEIKRWFESDAPKKHYLGVNTDDSHRSRVKAEILKEEAIGTFEAVGLYDDGSVKTKYRIDLKKADERLGPNNWVRESIAKQDKIPVSVGLWSIDVVKDNKRHNTNLDVRSAVLTRKPRNWRTFGQ